MHECEETERKDGDLAVQTQWCGVFTYNRSRRGFPLRPHFQRCVITSQMCCNKPMNRHVYLYHVKIWTKYLLGNEKYLCLERHFVEQLGSLFIIFFSIQSYLEATKPIIKKKKKKSTGTMREFKASFYQCCECSQLKYFLCSESSLSGLLLTRRVKFSMDYCSTNFGHEK